MNETYRVFFWGMLVGGLLVTGILWSTIHVTRTERDRLEQEAGRMERTVRILEARNRDLVATHEELRENQQRVADVVTEQGAIIAEAIRDAEDYERLVYRVIEFVDQLFAALGAGDPVPEP